AQDAGDVVHPEVTGREPGGIDAHAHDSLAPAEGDHVGHAGYRHEARFELFVDGTGQVVDRELAARDGELHHRLGVRVRLDDHEVLDAVGQVALDSRNRIADVVGGIDEVDVRPELDDHPQVAFLARRAYRVHAGDAGGGALDEPRRFGVERLRRGARIVGTHGDDRAVDVRQLAHLDPAQRAQAGDHDEQVHHDDQPGPPDRQARQVVGAVVAHPSGPSAAPAGAAISRTST